MEVFPIAKIDQNEVATVIENRYEYSGSPAAIAMELGGVAMKLARTFRVPRYDPETRENDAEHSYMLALVAPELAMRLHPGKLNVGLVSQFAVVHELMETKTGDVATFHFSAKDMAEKARREDSLLEELCQELPPYTAWLLREYHAQQRPEAKFTWGVDKLMPIIVDILGCGKQVMIEDYGVNTVDELEESHAKLHARVAEKLNDFPELANAHGLLCELFELEFDTTQLR